MPGVVHARLDALVQSPIVGCDLVPQFGVDGRCQRRGHAVVVLAKVGEVGAARWRGDSKWECWRGWGGGGVKFVKPVTSVDDI